MTKKKIAILVCAAVLTLTMCVSGTMAYLSDTKDLTNNFKLGDIEVSIREDAWDATDDNTEERLPGEVIDKDPTVKAVEGNSYLRIKVELLDNATGNVITDTDRAGYIWDTIVYDDADGTTYLEADGTKLTTTEIAGLAHYNPVFFEEDGPDGIKYYYYGTVGEDGITKTMTALTKGNEAVLFNKILIPSDYDNNTFDTMRGTNGYDIKITVEAVQADNVAATDAYANITSLYGPQQP